MGPYIHLPCLYNPDFLHILNGWVILRGGSGRNKNNGTGRMTPVFFLTSWSSKLNYLIWFPRMSCLEKQMSPTGRRKKPACSWMKSFEHLLERKKSNRFWAHATMPDRPFYKSRASKSIEDQFLKNTKMADFEALKLWKSVDHHFYP